MKKAPAIFGIGWIDRPEAGSTSPAEVTYTYIAHRDGDALADVLASVAGHAAGSGSYELDHAAVERVLAGVATADHGDGADILADMADEDGDAIVVFAAERSATHTDPHVARIWDVYESGRHEVNYGEAHWWPTDDMATDPYPLIDAWAKRWPDSLPIAHELKELFETQWVRFHSLAGSRRAAESEADWAGVMERHNAVLGELLKPGEETLVIVCEISPAPAPAEADIDFWTAIPWHYADPDLLYAHLYVTTEQWQPNELDELLHLAAEEQVIGVIIAPLDLGWLYHPYAGGADVILPSVADRDALAAKHAEWLSPHPSGL
jgi:hypothetical protein